MINGGLIAAKIKFKAWNRHEVGRNPSLIRMLLFSRAVENSIAL